MMAGNESEAIYLAYHLTGVQENYVDGWQASGRVWKKCLPSYQNVGSEEESWYQVAVQGLEGAD